MGTNKHGLIYFLLAVVNIVKTPPETQRAISRGWQSQQSLSLGLKAEQKSNVRPHGGT